MAENRLKQKLAWLIAIRAVIGTILLGSATIAQIKSPGSFPVNPFFLLIGLTYALTFGYAATLRFTERAPWLIDVQLAADALIVSAFIYLTGGVTSYFTSLYVLPIIAASTVQFRRGGLIVATFSALVYVGLVAAQYLVASGFLQDASLAATTVALPSRSAGGFTTALNVFGFFAVALLSGSLAEGLRSTGAQLEQASSELADLQALNQHVIDSLPSGLVTTDAQYHVLTFNRAAETISGLSFRSVIGRSITEILPLPADFTAGLEREGVGMRPRRVDLRYRTPDGRGDIELGLGASPIDAPGAGFLFTFQDVTDIKKLERDGRMRQRLAAVGEMAAGIAHEIRNPLASMSGSIQILRQELPLTAEQEQLMDIVLRESERLNNTIRSFLAYARPQKFAIERFDVRRALTDTARLLRNSAELRAGHVIDVDLPPDALWYEADEGQIKQIVWNLATNGLRAMPDGGLLRLVAGVDDDSSAIVISVRDEGVGIPPEELDRLFQPFHGTFARGTGLGLAIVHRIVSDYNGEIQVSSRPGGGTAVAVHLPARAVVALA